MRQGGKVKEILWAAKVMANLLFVVGLVAAIIFAAGFLSMVYYAMDTACPDPGDTARLLRDWWFLIIPLSFFALLGSTSWVKEWTIKPVEDLITTVL